jgi:glycosyltransferase involved in cell wall biosynthesis
MADMPFLSVILPNFNHAHLLPRAVNSLLAQERQPDEIVIIDDGSTDNSRSIIEQIAAKTPSVRVLFNETNRGAIPTLNQGLDSVRGRYVYLAAADDWVMPGFFKLAVDTLETNPKLGLFCGEAVLFDSHTNRILSVRPAVRPTHHARAIDPIATRGLLRRSDNWILTGTAVFRRDCMVWAGKLDQQLGSFADGFLARKIALTYGFFYAPRIVAAWVIFADSYSRMTAMDIDRARHILDEVPVRLASDPVFPSWYPKKFENRWRFSSCRLALESDPVNHALIATLGARSAIDRVALKAIWAISKGSLARIVALGWLWLRLRPTTLTGLVRTALAGRMRKYRKKHACDLSRAKLDRFPIERP